MAVDLGTVAEAVLHDCVQVSYWAPRRTDVLIGVLDHGLGLEEVDSGRRVALSAFHLSDIEAEAVTDFFFANLGLKEAGELLLPVGWIHHIIDHPRILVD